MTKPRLDTDIHKVETFQERRSLVRRLRVHFSGWEAAALSLKAVPSQAPKSPCPADWRPPLLDLRRDVKTVGSKTSADIFFISPVACTFTTRSRATASLP